MPKLIFIFFDGIGIGTPATSNPFFAAQADYFPLYQDGCILPDGTPIKPIDACLGIAGMPMSATGQTTLFTGINTPALLNEHRDSYPDTIMRKIIKNKNLFAMVKKNNFYPRFLNAFPGHAALFTPNHIRIDNNGELQYSVEFQNSVRRSLSVTTCMMIANQMIPYGKMDIHREMSLFHDYTNLSLNSDKESFPLFSPEKAAQIIFNVSRKYDLLLYEYFQTDFYGHGFEMNDCIQLIHGLNRLLKHLIALLDRENDTLLITSDHGNLEDSTTYLHTFNPVPLITWGNHSETLRDRISNLADVTPAVIEMFQAARQ